ncbi:hypothetical protein [Agarilytica rhodophyticola]|uniref:hypothetical protein n=1 Tax=Agarilytica rhodophyticola TaxID=1737490 RepID=UPI000B3463B4|nr:hypothetical protein [Agarilytica rhodophyticola]
MVSTLIQNIIVSDVFGRTEALEELASNFSGITVIHDPYSAKYMSFSNEQEVYTYFTEQITLDRYSDSLLKRIHSSSTWLNLIGFSVGASAIWRVSKTPSINNVVSAYCYYGSQIRRFSDIEPLFPTTLTFPVSENHFSVTELMDKLSNKPNITIRQVPYLHGFMNTHSVNYDRQGYKREVFLLREMLS